MTELMLNSAFAIMKSVTEMWVICVLLKVVSAQRQQ